MKCIFAREHIDLLYQEPPMVNDDSQVLKKKKRGSHLKDTPSFWTVVDLTIKELLAIYGDDFNSPGWKQ